MCEPLEPVLVPALLPNIIFKILDKEGRGGELAGAMGEECRQVVLQLSQLAVMTAFNLR